MKTYDVTIRAVVIKVIRVEAVDEDDANVEARERFCVAEVNPDEEYITDATYNEETLDIEEVKP
jgi:hypothetical protein